MANTIPLKVIYAREFQRTHYKKAVYPIFADLRFQSVLPDGGSVKWDYDSDMTADSLGSSDDSYTLNSKTITAETLTINQKPSNGFFIKGTEKIQDHRPTQEKWAKKSMNVIVTKIDGDCLKDMRDGAASTLDNASFGGSANDPITASVSNAASIFAAARRILKNQNVLYDSNKVFANNVKLDEGDRMPVAAIPAELEEKLLLQVGFKDTGAADKVMKSGFMGMMFGFNTVTSNSLPFSFRYTFIAQPGNGKVLTIGGSTTTVGSGDGVALNWVTTIGSTVGNVLSVTGATESVTNLAELLADPYGTTDAGMVVFVRADLSIAQKRLLDNISVVDNEDGSCVITIAGQGHVNASDDDANSTIDREMVHALFGVSRSIGMVMQRQPDIEVSAGNLLTTSETSGYVGKHYLAWSLYGRKVFKTQSFGLVNVKIDSNLFTSPNQVIL